MISESCISLSGSLLVLETSGVSWFAVLLSFDPAAQLPVPLLEDSATTGPVLRTVGLSHEMKLPPH